MENTLKILQAQNTIFKMLNGNNGVTVHFRYEDNVLSLITFNPKNDEYFLVKSIPLKTSHSSSTLEELTVYDEMVKYVDMLVHCIDKKEVYPSVGTPYTVTWTKAGEKINTSYFYGDNIEDVLSKFYYGKESIKHLFNILEIKQNSLS